MSQLWTETKRNVCLNKFPGFKLKMCTLLFGEKSKGLAIHFPCLEQSFWALCKTQQCGSLCRNVWLSFCIIVLPSAFGLYDSQNRHCKHLKLYSRTVFLKQLFLMFSGLVSSESVAEPITFYKGGKNDQFAEEFDRSWFSHCSGSYFLLLLLNGGSLKLLVKCDKILSQWNSVLINAPAT